MQYSKVVNKTVSCNCRIPQEINGLLEEIALSKNRTKTSIVIEALSLYLSKDITDENLVFKSLESLRRRISYVDKKIELLFNFYNFSLTTILAGLPDVSNYTPQEITILQKSANQRKLNMMKSFKKDMATQPGLLESLLADYIEIENGEDIDNA